jgi:site-specific recombinase XerD
MTEEQAVESLRAVEIEGRWSLVGPGPVGVDVVNDYLGYLADRGYSPRTVRAYAFDLLAFARWLAAEVLGVDDVSTEVLLRFLAFCRSASTPGRPGGNVYSIRDGRNVGYAATTINRRLAAISGLFSYRQMRDGSAANRCRAVDQRGGAPASTAVCWRICESPSSARGYGSGA